MSSLITVADITAAFYYLFPPFSKPTSKIGVLWEFRDFFKIRRVLIFEFVGKFWPRKTNIWCCIGPLFYHPADLRETKLDLMINLLGAIAKTAVALSCLSASTAVRPRGRTRLRIDGLTWNVIFEYFSKVFLGNWNFIKIWLKIDLICFIVRALIRCITCIEDQQMYYNFIDALLL